MQRKWTSTSVERSRASHTPFGRGRKEGLVSICTLSSIYRTRLIANKVLGFWFNKYHEFNARGFVYLPPEAFPNTEAVNCHEFCLVGVDLNKQNRRSVSGKTCCKTLLEVAACCSEANFSGAQLDVKRFEERYVCKGCFREVDRLHITYCTCTK